MSLDVAKLEKVHELAGGIVQAQCPACAEGGHDRKGNHLRIYADGRFGCCVCPQDKEHRKRIFALAGDKTPRMTFTVRICDRLPEPGGSRSVTAALSGFLGTLGTPKTESEIAIPAVLPGDEALGTLGTGESELETGVPSVPTSPVDDFGTLGTGIFKSRARTGEDVPAGVGVGGETLVEQLKDLESAVPSVPRTVGEGRLPYLNRSGDLMIPLDTPPRYRWWQGGQDIDVTLAEVRSWQEKQQGKD